MYEYKITKNQVVWYKDGKRVTRKEVPLREKLRAKKEIERTDIGAPIEESPLKKCIICESFPNFTRFYNGKIVEVCEDCYYNKTLGQIAEAIRKRG